MQAGIGGTQGAGFAPGGHRLRCPVQFPEGIAEADMGLHIIGAQPEGVAKSSNGFFMAALRGQGGAQVGVSRRVAQGALHGLPDRLLGQSRLALLQQQHPKNIQRLGMAGLNRQNPPA